MRHAPMPFTIGSLDLHFKVAEGAQAKAQGAPISVQALDYLSAGSADSMSAQSLLCRLFEQCNAPSWGVNLCPQVYNSNRGALGAQLGPFTSIVGVDEHTQSWSEVADDTRALLVHPTFIGHP